MGSLSENHVDSYEKKISIHQIYRMCQEGRIVFPDTIKPRRSKEIRIASETVEAVLLGIALPVIYMSERQDGSLLVLDTADNLRHLIGFMGDCYPIMGLEFYPELDGCWIQQLEQQFPRRAAWLYEYRFSFQIIEYTTPKYMHMQMGNYIGKWNLTREQGIRNGLYRREAVSILEFLARQLGQSVPFFSKWSLNRQYMVLRILMYRLVFEGEMQAGWEVDMGLQQMLDQTMEYLEKKDWQWEEEIEADIREATEVLADWERGESVLRLEKGKERQAKTLGYLYNVVWLCRKRGHEVQWGLEQVVLDRYLWGEINSGQVNYKNIRKHYHEIEERLR